MEWTEVGFGIWRHWKARMESLLLSVAYDPDDEAYLWTVGPEGALPMARGRRWNSWTAREDAENAARQLTS